MKSFTRDAPPEMTRPRSLATALSRWAPGLIALSMLIGTATYGGLSLDPGVYTSSSQMRMSAGRQSATPTAPPAANRDAISRELMILRSRDLALAVAADLKLDASAAFQATPQPLTLFDRLIRLVGTDPNSPPAGESSEERTVRLFTRAVRVVHAPGTDIVTVSFTSADRELAARAANRIVDLYRTRTNGLPPAKPAAATRVAAGPILVDVLSRATPWATMTATERLISAGLAAGATLIIGFALAGLLASMSRSDQPDTTGDADAFAQMARFDASTPIEVRSGQQNGEHSRRDRVEIGADPVTSSTFDRHYEPLESIGQFFAYRSIGPLSRRLIGNSETSGGYRSLVVSEAPGQAAREEATDLAAALCAAGKQVALVDWSLDGRGIATGLGVRAMPGFMDLIEERATFDDVIQRLPDGDVHVIACGSPQSGGNLDTERLNLVLDTLDEVYDHIIVTGTDEAARVLFLAVEGRFDACVTVGDKRADDRRVAPETETFLGYHVTDIDLLRLEAITPERRRVAKLNQLQDSREVRV